MTGMPGLEQTVVLPQKAWWVVSVEQHVCMPRLMKLQVALVLSISFPEVGALDLPHRSQINQDRQIMLIMQLKLAAPPDAFPSLHLTPPPKDIHITFISYSHGKRKLCTEKKKLLSSKQDISSLFVNS